MNIFGYKKSKGPLFSTCGNRTLHLNRPAFRQLEGTFTRMPLGHPPEEVKIFMQDALYLMHIRSTYYPFLP